MKSLDQWFSEYAVSHQNKINKKIHYVCVPLIVYSLMGVLDALSHPDYLNAPFSLAVIFMLAVIPFYVMLSKSLGTFTAALVALGVASLSYFPDTQTQLYFNLGVFIVAWIGQFIGHKIEGKKPSFIEDLAFLLIGPLWVMQDLTGGKLHKRAS